MYEKKYYTIGETTKILGVSSSQLRYVEKISSQLSVNKIRGRRYYTLTNIRFIKDKIKQQPKRNQKSITNNTNVEKKIDFTLIDNLISKFNILSCKITDIVSSISK